MNFYTQKYIYKITNKINGLAYIGQANDYKRRFTEHHKYKVNPEVDTKLLYVCATRAMNTLEIYHVEELTKLLQ